MSDQVRVRMIKTMAPVEIPNGTLGAITGGSVEHKIMQVTWDNGYVMPMYPHEIEVVDEA